MKINLEGVVSTLNPRKRESMSPLEQLNSTCVCIWKNKIKFPGSKLVLQSAYGATIKDEVIIGSCAQILGPIVINKGVRIGSNAVILNDCPKYSYK